MGQPQRSLDFSFLCGQPFEELEDLKQSGSVEDYIYEYELYSS